MEYVSAKLKLYDSAKTIITVTKNNRSEASFRTDLLKVSRLLFLFFLTAMPIRASCQEMCVLYTKKSKFPVEKFSWV